MTARFPEFAKLIVRFPVHLNAAVVKRGMRAAHDREDLVAISFFDVAVGAEERIVLTSLPCVGNNIRLNFSKIIGEIAMLEYIEEGIMPFPFGDGGKKLDLHGINRIFFFVDEQYFHSCLSLEFTTI